MNPKCINTKFMQNKQEKEYFSCSNNLRSKGYASLDKLDRHNTFLGIF